MGVTVVWWIGYGPLTSSPAGAWTIDVGKLAAAITAILVLFGLALFQPMRWMLRRIIAWLVNELSERFAERFAEFGDHEERITRLEEWRRLEGEVRLEEYGRRYDDLDRPVPPSS